MEGKMKAFISALSDGHSKIEFVDEWGNTLDIYDVEAIHVEMNRENNEPLTRMHKPQTLRSGRFYAN